MSENQKTRYIAEDLGYLFEIGFNTGILSYISQQKLKHCFGSLYEKDLQKLRFPKLHERICARANLIAPDDIQFCAKWSLFFLQKGFLCGFNFLREYLESLDSRKKGWEHDRLEILYYQCSFCGQNSFGTNPKSQEAGFKDVLSQLGKSIDIKHYQKSDGAFKAGEFPNADTLMLLRYRRKLRLLCVDLSVFSVKSVEDIEDLDNVEILRKILRRDIGYLRSKSVFSQLSIEMGTIDFKFSQDLTRYFNAFKSKDKETAKLIQAGSYAYSFYEFLGKTNLFTEGELNALTFNVFGYSDRSFNAMSLRPDNLKVLASCHQIYTQQQKERELNEARDLVFRTIRRNAAKSFIDGKKFIADISAFSTEGLTRIVHQEKITDFFNSLANVPPELMAQIGLSGTMNLRDAHAALIRKALIGNETYLFLTGNPGIGKTTAIVEFLKQHVDDGFLFFYVSPRIQVNRDIVEKFKIEDVLCDNRLFCLNTNSAILESNLGEYTVQYLANLQEGRFEKKGVHFIDMREKLPHQSHKKNQQVKRITEDLIQPNSQYKRGVLSSLCEAIATSIEQNISNNIVATVSLQSLKKTRKGKDTLEHFRKLFRSAVYDPSINRPIASKMREISARYKHLFIMIDEITGDESGVEFLSGIHDFINHYKLTESQHGFNTKIIVADASIIDPDVINRHLSDRQAERDKIFFRPASGRSLPLTLEPFTHKSLSAILINANSYPAKYLDITYKIFVNPRPFSKTQHFDSFELVNRVQTEIYDDINTLLTSGNSGQIIVYIQGKQRLKILIEMLREKWGKFEPFVDYIEIHAHISDRYRDELQKHKNKVKIIFMTSSASRGLSFPKTKHILVDVPRFEIEKNLMEIIQVIYRGRGEYLENGARKTLDQEEKNLTFYLHEFATYNEKDPSKDLRETKLALTNILLILKTAVMTRIAGSGQIGKHSYLMIPIGGKSVFAASETFSGKMASLIDELKKEYQRHYNDRLLKDVYCSLKDLLARVRIVLTDTVKPAETISYLSLRQDFAEKFESAVDKGFDRLLLTFERLEKAHIHGSLLIVPLGDKTVQEKFEIRLEKLLGQEGNAQLWSQLRQISQNPQYPSSLRSATRGAIDLADSLQGQESLTQRLEENSQRGDRYYALPLLTLVSSQAMQDYFSQHLEEPQGQTFRELLAIYLRFLYPVDKMLPLGSQYEEFPFVVFHSYSLNEIRDRIFTDKQLFNSHELNVLNLILATEED